LLADALKLTEPEREGWFDAARCLNARRAGPTTPVVPGFEKGSKSWRHRSFTTEFRVEVVCEFAIRVGPGQAQPFERPVMADDERLKSSQSPTQAQLPNELSNRDIAAQLLLSPRTVGYHLQGVPRNSASPPGGPW
jgi:hypothetical protein